MHVDEIYHQLCKDILQQNHYKDDRTNTGTYSLFGYQMRFDLSEGFPAITTKKLFFKTMLSELIWFIKGDTNIKFLLQHNNNIWNEWAFKNWVESSAYDGPDMSDFAHRSLTDEAFNEQYKAQMAEFKHKILTDDDFSRQFGNLGDVYGKQWRKWQTTQGQVIDQLADVIQQIKTNPNSRRLIVSAWNPEDIPTMALPPCHTLFQFYVQDNKLSCQLYQRSADVFLGVPFNIASYALLTHLIAHECHLEVGEFIHTIGDAHIYKNHVAQIEQQLSRTSFPMPKLKINDELTSIFDIKMEDIELVDYQSHPSIKAPIAV